MKIGPYTHEEYMEAARKFHGFAAPGLVMGGYMVELARQQLPPGVLFEAISETNYCLPDAIQLLTPCTYGNGRLKEVNLGLFALSLFDKQTAKGVRVYLDINKLDRFPTIKEWFLKLKPKREQDGDLLQEEIYEAKTDIYSLEQVEIKPEYAAKRSKGPIALCAICGEPHPARFGLVCRSCQGQSPYQKGPGLAFADRPELRAMPLDQAVGQTALHDMTKVVPGQEKGAAIQNGQVITEQDKEKLRSMGRNKVYVEGPPPAQAGDWKHENEVAAMLAEKMPGSGVRPDQQIREGKISFFAEHDGVIWLDLERLNLLNRVPGVVCSTQHCGAVVQKDALLAAARSVPLYLGKAEFLLAQNALGSEPLLQVLPLRQAKVGILVTGSEVYNGVIEDRFEQIIRHKTVEQGCEVVAAAKAPDDLDAICEAVRDLQALGADLLVVTGGLSVDPEDYTRQALIKAGLRDYIYGMPVLPGAMSLVGKLDNDLGRADVLGVPAGALFCKTTAFDFMLPLVLAKAPISRDFVDQLGHGGLCLSCKICTYPKCGFIK